MGMLDAGTRNGCWPAAASSGEAGGISRLGPLIKVLKAVKLVHTPIITIAIV